MFIPRALDIAKVAARKSVFLFGPRQTGKSMLLRASLPAGTPFYDLLDHATWLRLNAEPIRLGQELAIAPPPDGLVVIDEIQRLPELLNEVHRLIESNGVRFVLTGSSARKLRRSGVNLLGGRARMRHLHPLSAWELGREFDLATALNRGLLPSIYFSDDPDDDLRAYVGTYLREEIAAEGLTRNVPAFARFLEVAAASNATMINKTSIANDAKVPRTTVHEYIEILKDTLLGYELAPYTASQKRKAIETARLYLFDVGVTRALRGLGPLAEGSADFGPAFEHLVLQELMCYIDARAPGTPLAWWRSTSGFEVDFVLGGETAIEVKAARNISNADLKGLFALHEEGRMKRLAVVCREPVARRFGPIDLLPFDDFVQRLWAGDLLGSA